MARSKKKDDAPTDSAADTEVRDGKPQAEEASEVIRDQKKAMEDMEAKIESLESEHAESTAVAAVQRQLGDTQRQLAEVKKRAAKLTRELGEMRIATGAHTPLTYDDVREEMEDNPTARFQLCADYNRAGATMKAGRSIDSRHYPHLLSYIQDGMKLIPAQT